MPTMWSGSSISCALPPARADPGCIHPRTVGNRYGFVGHPRQGDGAAGRQALGGYRDRVPAYASGALMRTQSLDDVATAAGRLVDRGWTAMKTQLALPGDTSPEKEVERIRVIREIIGPDVLLMCDINQRWSVHQAINIGQRVKQYNLHWLRT